MGEKVLIDTQYIVAELRALEQTEVMQKYIYLQSLLQKKEPQVEETNPDIGTEAGE